MATPAFEEIVEDFAFLEDWEDRYRYVIEQGKAMEPLPDALKVPATKVDGCASQVWLNVREEDGKLRFDGDSDAHIVRGLVAVLLSLYSDKTPAKIMALDATSALAPLDLAGHLTPQRSNGLAAMAARIRAEAAAALEAANA